MALEIPLVPFSALLQPSARLWSCGIPSFLLFIYLKSTVISRHALNAVPTSKASLTLPLEGITFPFGFLLLHTTHLASRGTATLDGDFYQQQVTTLPPSAQAKIPGIVLASSLSLSHLTVNGQETDGLYHPNNSRL